MKLKVAVFMMTALMATSSIVAFADEGTGKFTTFMAGGAEVKLDKTNGEVQKLLASDKKLGIDTVPSPKLELVDVVLPKEYDGNAVTAIKQNGFCDYDAMKSLELPESVNKLGDYAFNGCDNIKTVKLPSAVTEISKYCFASCDNLSSVTLSSSTLKIGDYAFSKCVALSSVSIPSSTKEIGANAFEGTALTSIDVPNSVDKLGNAVFKNCASLKSFSLGSGIQTIPTDCFNSCNSLTEISIPETVKSIDHTAFSNCANLKTVYIPDSVAKISTDAFKNSPNVTIACNSGSPAEIFAKKAGIATTSYETKTTQTTASKVVPNVISVTINGEKQTFTQDPVNMNGSVLVPMRAIFEALGADVSWNGDTRTVSASRGATNVTCTIDRTKGTLNGRTVELATAPKIVNGSTMVPVRFVSESLGCTVSWEADTQTVIITSK
jgi:hypothetical protein